jgi:hypothetical protein
VSGEIGFTGDERQALVRTSKKGWTSPTSTHILHPMLERIDSLDVDGFTLGHPTIEPASARRYCANHPGATYYWIAFRLVPGEAHSVRTRATPSTIARSRGWDSLRTTS